MKTAYTISALGSVYSREHPDHLRAALNSLAEQTSPANEVVLVIDGPIGCELESVIGQFAGHLPLKLIRLANNSGLGKALNAGLDACTGDLIARFDTDDVNMPERFAVQRQCFECDVLLDICGSAVAEFADSPDRLIGLRTVPLSSRGIYRWSWLRNPFNHPTIMFRRSSARRFGGYKDCSFFEDFVTWNSWLNKGATARNLSQSLVLMRVGDDFYRRRGTLNYVRHELNAAKVLLRERQMSPQQFIAFVALRVPLRLMPLRPRAALYKLMRKRAS